MSLLELFHETFLYEEKGESLLLLDIDDTLVKAKNIFIYRRLPTDKGEVKLTPDEYANDPYAKVADNKQYYDYREFRNADKIARSIKTGLPIVKNLKIMDEYIKKGWKIGILTARGMEEVVFKAMKAWLMFRNTKGNLHEIGDRLVRNLVKAINDDDKHYPGSTDFEKKANVLKQLAKQYDRIVLVDDDPKNINAAKELKLQNVHTKLAER